MYVPDECLQTIPFLPLSPYLEKHNVLLVSLIPERPEPLCYPNTMITINDPCLDLHFSYSFFRVNFDLFRCRSGKLRPDYCAVKSKGKVLVEQAGPCVRCLTESGRRGKQGQ